MAALLFEIGRYSAFLGAFFFAIFGISLWLFRSALNREGVSLLDPDQSDEEQVRVGSVGLGETVLYLRRRDYEKADDGVKRLGRSYHKPIVWPFYLGVWSFCLGLALMSVTFGFVLFE